MFICIVRLYEIELKNGCIGFSVDVEEIGFVLAVCLIDEGVFMNRDLSFHHYRKNKLIVMQTHIQMQITQCRLDKDQ